MKLSRALSIRFALPLALGLLSGPAVLRLSAQDCPEKKADDKKEEKPDPACEAIDTDSPEAKTLAKKLHVPANWRPKSGTIDVAYSFSDEPQMLDWRFQGADKAEPKDGLELGVSSSGASIGLLDGVEVNGDFTIEATIKVLYFGPSSEVVFVFGAKGGEAFGARWGDQLVRVRKSGKLAPLQSIAASQDKFAEQKTVEVKIQRTGDEIQTWINKMERPKRKFAKKELDGKVGIFAATNVRLSLTRFRLFGAIKKV